MQKCAELDLDILKSMEGWSSSYDESPLRQMCLTLLMPLDANEILFINLYVIAAAFHVRLE